MENEIHYLLEGFIRNRRFAPGVYLGFAYFERLKEDAQNRQYGTWALLPRRSKLATGKYAYLMKALNEKWRLDRCLYEKCLFNDRVRVAEPEGIEFLAREVARLHKLTKRSSSRKGSPESIANKLTFNAGFFQNAMAQLASGGLSTEGYTEIIGIMNDAIVALAPDFSRRYEQGHIRVCHGDLKLTNLWIRPASTRYGEQRLLALDCIDFNPDFYHVDTLSDVAMLLMDLQMHLQPSDSDLIKEFKKIYLQKMGEEEKSATRLLTYYMAEKAIVCTNVSILLDKDTVRGLQYLALAQLMSKDLENQFRLPVVEQTAIQKTLSMAG